jgi:hypothetical protein
MAQASQTFRKEKAPSVDALKGLVMFVIPNGCVAHRPLRGIFSTRYDIDRGHNMQHNFFVACLQPSLKAKFSAQRKSPVMARSRIASHGTPPPN